MLNPNFVLLYVADPRKSAEFYTELLGQQPVDVAPTFAMFVLSSGLKLGLWLKGNVEPKAAAHTGGSELCVGVESADRVRAIYATWTERGLPMLQTPTEMDFGHTFVAEDPDGHRLRVFAPTAA